MELVLDTTAGTHVLGSRFGRLLTTYRDREGDNFQFETVSKLQYLDGNWIVARVDDEIARYYATQIEKRFGITLQWRARAGTHVSVVRGEAPRDNAEHWGKHDGLEVPIKYTHDVYTNGQHWWLNVLCDDFADIRGFYGLGTTKRWFHLTIGRL